MQLTGNDVDNIFDYLTATLEKSDATLCLLSSLEDLRPNDPSIMDWRYELRGFVRGLTFFGVIPSKELDYVQKSVFGQFVTGDKRPGREFKFSVDVYAKSLTDEERLFNFDVAASNSTDAYVQLTKRLVFRTIPDIFRVEVFDSFQDERGQNQKPARIFNKDELIFVTK